MRLSPTSALASVFATCVVLGCAAAHGEPADLSDPNGSSASKNTNDESKTPRPEFEAGFEGTPDAGPGTGGDPTPANSDQCLDPNDPGGSENVAKQLPATDDCDNDFKTVSGVANGAIDLDFYKLSGTDKTLCNVEADFNSSTAGLELCVFARCKNSTANAVTGCSAGTATTNSIGLKGCCATTPGKAIPTWDCSGLSDDDSADFVITVKQVNGEKCLPYKFQYHF